MKRKRYANFSGMCWPLPDGAGDESVSYKLRYAPEALTKEDQLYAASILNAYDALIDGTQEYRNKAVKGIREAEKTTTEEG